VLILQKKSQKQKDDEEKNRVMADYNIFMAMLEKIGHDKRGNDIFKRDKEGNEILVPDTDNILVLGDTADGDKTVSKHRKTKLPDDQTFEVPTIFKEWKIKEGIAW
jgi:type I restriction enzyme M protein